MGKLDGKIALITGSTSGIGRATAFRFASEGATVLVVGRNCERGKSIESKINDNGGKCEFIECDLLNVSEIKRVCAYVESKYSMLNILINNAGVWITKNLEEIDMESKNIVFSTNFDSMLFLTQGLEVTLKKSKGVIVNTASMGGLESYTNGIKQYLYHSSKAAVIKFSKLIAKNFAPEVRVNCICPGLIDTEIFENRDFSRFDNQIPLGRLGKADEVAELFLFLSSEDSSYITGAVIPIDGGASLT